MAYYAPQLCPILALSSTHLGAVNSALNLELELMLPEIYTRRRFEVQVML
ncbi:MAG: hypothetical protein ABFS03_08795 [Chloroflexota bacterium]